MKFDLIPPELLQACWPQVRAGLERIKDVGKAVRWIPEDVFTHIKLGRAQLRLGYDGERYAGFLVTEMRRDVFTNEPYLNVWCLYAEPQEGKEHFAGIDPFIAETFAYLDRVGREAGALWLRAEGREGWTKVLAGIMEPVMVVYERKLT